MPATYTKIAAYDPGRIRDGFGMVAAEVSRTEIQITNAASWYGKDFIEVAKDIGMINRKVRYDIHLVETNHSGHFVADYLRKYEGITPRRITTVKEIKDIKKLRDGNSMGKYQALDWIEGARAEGIIRMPRRGTWTKGLRELDRQLTNFVRRSTKTNVSYEAADENVHDDLVMALALIAHYSRVKLLRLSGQLSTPMAYNDTSIDLKNPEDKLREEMLARTIGRFEGDRMKFEEVHHG